MAQIDIQVPDIGDFDEVAVIEVLVKVGDSITTDHISPAGAIGPDSPACQYLQKQLACFSRNFGLASFSKAPAHQASIVLLLLSVSNRLSCALEKASRHVTRSQRLEIMLRISTPSILRSASYCRAPEAKHNMANYRLHLASSLLLLTFLLHYFPRSLVQWSKQLPQSQCPELVSILQTSTPPGNAFFNSSAATKVSTIKWAHHSDTLLTTFFPFLSIS